MTISKEFISIITGLLEAQLDKFEKESFTFDRTERTPDAVTNIRDYYFGQLIGGLHFTLKDFYQTKYLRKFDKDELEQFDVLFMKYQNKFAKYIYG